MRTEFITASFVAFLLAFLLATQPTPGDAQLLHIDNQNQDTNDNR